MGAGHVRLRGRLGFSTGEKHKGPDQHADTSEGEGQHARNDRQDGGQWVADHPHGLVEDPRQGKGLVGGPVVATQQMRPPATAHGSPGRNGRHERGDQIEHPGGGVGGDGRDQYRGRDNPDQNRGNGDLSLTELVNQLAQHGAYQGQSYGLDGGQSPGQGIAAVVVLHRDGDGHAHHGEGHGGDD